MKKISNMILMLSLILTFGFIGLANAQRIVHIAPTAFGIINTTINGDTLANGDRVDPNTIYELERGTDKYYLFNGTLTNVGYHLHIRATGEGDRPKLVPGVLAGGISALPFLPRGDLTLEGLYVTSMDNSNTFYSQHMISAGAENIRVTIDDCLLNGDRSSHLETDAKNQSVFITNSILSYTFNNGRGVDRRGNLLDTLVMQNCTYINIGSNPLRWGGSSYANFIKFDHVTWCNVGEDVAQLGEVVDLTFTNNLMINAGWKGTEDDGSPSQLFRLRPLTSPDLSGKTQSLTIRNNNFWLDPQIINFYGNLDVSSGSNNIPITTRIWGDSLTNTLLDSSSFLNQPVEFTNGPSIDSLFAALKEIWEELDGNRDGQTIIDTGPEGTQTYGNPLFGIFPFDLSYSTSASSYTAGDGGLPLGDLNWFPDKKIIWLTDIEDSQLSGSPSKFSLSQNFPNPFNPSTNILYSIPEPGLVSIKVFDVLGRQISELVNKQQSAGTHTLDFDAQNLSAGVYFYKIESGSFQASKKMILMK